MGDNMKNAIRIICINLCIILPLILSTACQGNKKTENHVASETQNTQSIVSNEGSSTDNGTVSDSASVGDSTSSSSTPLTSKNQGNSDSTSNIGNSSNANDGGTTSTPAVENQPTVQLTATKNGDTVTVTASVKNNSGLTGFDLKLTYDKDVVTPQSFKSADKIDITSNLMQPNADCNGQVTAIYASANGFKTDGELFSVEFKVKDNNAERTDFSLETKSNSFVDLNVKYVIFTAKGVTANLK